MKRKILFVDDEPKVLRGLRRLLSSMRQEWDMEFAESGHDALTRLQNDKLDVIVSDMRMPGMDGRELLETVAKRHPEMVRIVLSGQSDQQTILQATDVAHQYLSKPCQPELLKSTVTRAFALRDLLNNQRLKGIVSQIKTLPSQPKCYTAIMDELKSQEPSLVNVGAIISKDVAMTAKILQLVNSSFFGLPRRISAPSQAAQLLGIDQIKALVLSAGVFSQFNSKDMKDLNLEQVWDHSSRVGSHAKRIAKMERAGTKTEETALMAGLLHDIGKLILAANLTKEYREAAALCRSEHLEIHEAEHQILGVTHAEVGAFLLGLWGLPDLIVETVAFHHTPTQIPSTTFGPLTAVYAANIQVSQQEQKDASTTKQETPIDQAYLTTCGVDSQWQQWHEALEECDLS